MTKQELINELKEDNTIELLEELRMTLKRMLHTENGKGKTLHLIASDDDATIIDIDSFLKSENWEEEIIEVLRSFKSDMESFGLKFTKIQII